VNLCQKTTIVITIILTFVSNALAINALEHKSNMRLKSILAKYSWLSRSPTPTTPAPTPAPATAGLPLFDTVEKAANSAGINPAVMYAIAWHETGGFRSSLWRRANNPGGIKYTRNRRSGRSGIYAAYKTPEEGIRAQATVLLANRYRAARQTSDPYAQVAAIYRAGYCAPGYNWAAQVKRYVRRFLGCKNTTRTVTI